VSAAPEHVVGKVPTGEVELAVVEQTGAEVRDAAVSLFTKPE
jgi:hypothetical protein